LLNKKLPVRKIDTSGLFSGTILIGIYGMVHNQRINFKKGQKCIEPIEDWIFSWKNVLQL